MTDDKQTPNHLRLTLRTLLAWLDDTLPSEEARHIGKLVEESTYAQQLVERIEKVTRRRRLTVPPATGPESIDPNQVASYLDSELESSLVAEFERRCLSDDVELAEVAGCHQVLSMLGQKARVPPEAKYRMYRLIRGREALGQYTGGSDEEPIVAALPPWERATAASPRRGLRRLLPLVTLAGLIGLLAASTWTLLPGPGTQPPTSPANGVERPGIAAGPGDQAPAPAKPALASNEPVPPEPGDASEAAVASNSEMPAAPEDEAAKPAEPAPADTLLPPGILGRLGPDTTLILRPKTLPVPNPAGASLDWTRMQPNEEVKAGDQLACLEPFHARLEVAGLAIDLVGPSRLVLAEPQQGELLRVALENGQFVARNGTQPGSIAVTVGKSTLQVTPPPSAVVGFDRLDSHEAGLLGSTAPVVRVHLPAGEVRLMASGSERTVNGPARIDWTVIEDADDPSREALGQPQPEALPPWAVNEEPTQEAQLRGVRFLADFDADRTIRRALEEALLDEQEPTNRLLAIKALALLEEIRVLCPVLVAEGYPEGRRLAAEMLRRFADHQPDHPEVLAREFSDFATPEWAQTATQLLKGYSEEDAQKPATLQTLVGWLEDGDVAIRTLALDELKRLTNRADSLEYNPDEPAVGKGVANWQALIRSNPPRSAAPPAQPAAIPPAGPPPADPTPAPTGSDDTP